jgi:hypothetical protein
MKRIIKLTETELNKIISKIIKEQEEDQFMTDKNPEQMAGGTEDDPSEGGEPNYEEFLTCAKTLLDQGATIGNLVDKLVEGQGNEESEAEPEPEAEPEDNTGGESELAPQPQGGMSESRKKKATLKK